MKRLLLVLAALVLMMGAAQASVPEEVVPLYDLREDGDVFVGTAVAAGDGFYVTGGMDGVNLVQPYVVTGEGRVYATRMQSFENGLTMLLTDSKQESAPVSAKKVSGTVRMISCTGSGLTVQNGRVLYDMTWRGSACLLVEAEGAVSMGTAVYDATQALCGVVVAGWGEGVNRYVLLPVGSFYGGEEMPDVPDDEEGDGAFTQWLDKANGTVQGHLLTVTWTADMLENVQEDSIVTVLIADEQNSYYSWAYAKAEEGSLLMPVAPGRTYRYAVQHAYGETVRDGEWYSHAVTLEMPQARPYNRFGYQDEEIYIGTLPATDEPYTLEKAAKPEKITRALLEDESLSVLMQVTSKYRVRREETCEMLITLTTPDGTMFMEMASYVFMPELAEGDVWNSNLDPMLDDYLMMNKDFEAGEYRVDYYFDGTLVNSVTFTLD